MMTEPQKYSASEIALHASKRDCWIVIHGKVYDVTSFLEEHPGGEEPLLQAAASGDATEAFEDVGHSTSAVSMMEGYLISAADVEGYIPSSTEPSAASASKKVQHKKKKQQQQQQPPSYSYSEYLFPLLVLALAFAAWFCFSFYTKANE